MISNRCIAVSCGTMEYLSAWELQRRLHSQVAEGVLPNVLLLLEHPHVYTLGRRGSASDILATPEQLTQLGVEVHHVDRGGEVTYHGPGQLVGYPIVDLRKWGGGPLRYVRALEQILVATLAELGIDARTDHRPTGVWIGDAKIASIGVKVGRGVTSHGFALNVNPDLTFFDHIVPCGISSCPVTSIAAQRPELTDLSQVTPAVARHFGEVFGMSIDWGTREALEQDTPLLTPYR